MQWGRPHRPQLRGLLAEPWRALPRRPAPAHATAHRKAPPGRLARPLGKLFQSFQQLGRPLCRCGDHTPCLPVDKTSCRRSGDFHDGPGHIGRSAILRNGGKGLFRISSAPGQQTGKATHGKGVGISGIIRKDLVQDGERGIEIVHDHMRKCQPHKGRREPRPERQDCLKNGPCLPSLPRSPVSSAWGKCCAWHGSTAICSCVRSAC